MAKVKTVLGNEIGEVTLSQTHDAIDADEFAFLDELETGRILEREISNDDVQLLGQFRAGRSVYVRCPKAAGTMDDEPAPDCTWYLAEVLA